MNNGTRITDGDYGEDGGDTENEGEWYKFGGKVNWAANVGSASMELSSASMRITNDLYNGSKFSPKWYRSGWAGGSRAGIKTFNIAKLGKFAGGITAVGGVVLDGFGVYKYYRDPTSPNAVSPTKALVNTGISVYSYSVNL